MEDFPDHGAFLSMPVVSLCSTQHGFSPLAPHPADFKPYHKNFYHQSLILFYFIFAAVFYLSLLWLSW